jgi:hypothetical protein
MYGHEFEHFLKGCHCDEPRSGEEAISTIDEIASLRSQ